MPTWSEFVDGAPQLADVARRLWPGVVALEAGRPTASDGPTFTVAYLATVRPDGAPRLHPFCPILAGGRLFAAIPRSSPKGNDLRRDPRCAIHAMPGPDDDELSFRAIGAEVDDVETVVLVRAVVGRSGVGGMIESVGRDPLFEFDLQRVDVATWVNVGRPGTYAVRHRWPTAGGDAGEASPCHGVAE